MGVLITRALFLGPCCLWSPMILDPYQGPQTFGNSHVARSVSSQRPSSWLGPKFLAELVTSDILGYIYIYVYAHVSTSVYTYVYIYICTHLSICINIHTYVYIYIYIYIFKSTITKRLTCFGSRISGCRSVKLLAQAPLDEGLGFQMLAVFATDGSPFLSLSLSLSFSIYMFMYIYICIYICT